MARSGARWRDLPEQFGGFETVKRRYYRWIEMGVLDGILAALAREADLEWLMIGASLLHFNSSFDVDAGKLGGLQTKRPPSRPTAGRRGSSTRNRGVTDKSVRTKCVS